MNSIQAVDKSGMRSDLPPIRTGDTVRVHVKIKEGDKFRIQIFEGIVMARKRSGISSTFTVRKVTSGYGVERIFPVHSPIIDKLEVVKGGKVRRSRLYYLRALRGKAARLKEKGKSDRITADAAEPSRA